jgi:glycosyltransferase involved in cell wall biosynthesis
MKLISIVTPTYNEEENVVELCQQVKKVMNRLPNYAYEHIFIDNASTDRTVELLKELTQQDEHIKIIVNTRNFGHVRSPHHGLLQAEGDAVICLVADFQDPPEMIVDFVKNWEDGYKVVLGVKSQSQESPLMFAVRKAYYDFVNWISEVKLTKNSTGFGLYDKQVLDVLRSLNDPYPYGRGLVADMGFQSYKIEYLQPVRKRGITKNNFYTLYDLAMLGIVSHSKVPLRIATMLGFAMSAISMVIALGYFVAKMVFWDKFTLGTAPIIIGLFFFGSVQLFFIGIIGEYIGAIHTQILKRPLVVEKERINF